MAGLTSRHCGVSDSQSSLALGQRGLTYLFIAHDLSMVEDNTNLTQDAQIGVMNQVDLPVRNYLPGIHTDVSNQLLGYGQ
jgi:ABC-type dipeptide/oligopeptide/nickel transport system ATPase subunit